MPVSARGHGAYGLRSNLRLYAEMDSLSACRRHTYCDVYAGQIIGDGGWTATGGGSWHATYDQTFDGKAHHLIGVEILGGTLTRVGSTTACDAGAGTWFWEVGTDVYVHLPDGSDPNDIDLMGVSIFGIWSGSKKDPSLWRQPILGPNVFVDGGLEVWTNPNTLTNWTFSQSSKGAFSNNQDDPLIQDGGSYSSKIIGTTTLATGTLAQGVALVAGKSYRVSGVYKTDSANPSGATVRILVPSSGANPLTENGRDLGSGTGVAMTNTRGEIRRFSFDVIWPTGGSNIGFQFDNQSGAAATMWWDDLKVQRIYGFRLYEPRLSAEGVPELTAGSQSVYPGTEIAGGGQLVILNDATEAITGIHGFVECMISRWGFSNQRVVYRHGGQFLDDGQEILWEDMAYGFTGLIRKPGGNDFVGRFDLEA